MSMAILCSKGVSAQDSLKITNQQEAQKKHFTGQIIDAQTKQSLPGATIKIPAANLIFKADDNGRFDFELSDSIKVLVFEYSDNEEQSTNVSAKSNDILILLQEKIGKEV